MALLITLAVVLSTLLAGSACAQETPLQQYTSAMSGRWVSDTVADNDVAGYMKKGDRLRLEITFRPLPDGSGMRQQWHLENGGEVRGRLNGITLWDAASNRIKSYGTATDGYHVEGEQWKEGDQWMSKSVVTFPNGSKATSNAATTFSDDGDTRTVLITNRINQNGEKLADKTEVWRRISKNHEMLEKHLAWIIGGWTAQMDTVQGPLDVEADYQWIADDQVIQLNLKMGDWKGLSIIFFDPSDQKIKMWANSAGGNGQAVMEVGENELAWTNTTFDTDGMKQVNKFNFLKGPDDHTMIIKYVDETDGKTKTLINKRK